MSAILVVEDDETVAGVVELALTLGEHRVDRAATARAGKERLEAGEYDLLLFDVNLPDASGLELLEFVRNQLKRSTPVIMLSALQQKDVVVRALEMGANDYMTKPFAPQELLARVKTWTTSDEK